MIVIAYGMYDEQEARRHVPKVVLCQQDNRGTLLCDEEPAGTTTDELLAVPR